MEFFKKEETKTKEEKMTREEAFLKIEKWANETRAKVYGESLLDLQNVLWVAVVDGRLSLDENEKRKFVYVLEEPVKSSRTNEVVLSMIQIKPQIVSKVFEVEKCKSTDAKSSKLIETYCRSSEGEEIPIGNIMSFDPRDTAVIQAVIGAFFL
jgi:hypothetical protein